MSALLEIEDLRVEFRLDTGTVTAVDGISLAVGEGETLAVVGESGSGKTATALSVLRLNPVPPCVYSGQIRFAGRDLLGIPEKELRRIRGNEIAMIFQDPMTSLNPLKRVGAQIAEVVRRHRGASRSEARAAVVPALREAGINDAEQRAEYYPHQLSGGLRQRVMIAMALVGRPRVLIADEPTTALDVTVQAQILDLLAELRERHGMAVVLITHDLGVVAEIADRVVVMRHGQVVESGDVLTVFEQPGEDYTRELLRATPRLERA
nr:ABC transporter ATP-binding protein [Kibdelosporangium sp. MJ126-NF4]CEL20801.1 Oligopeptide transport system permease protein OppB (TC 3.A.1.5.1) [Kibdelosporangium sp. MJ126-NF4]CTQ98394.1 Oligopeptide transport system permease protein OppB (TC 3.A.1.5.1) [Kibdelosporangium sp. MJ126-NF4]